MTPYLIILIGSAVLLVVNILQMKANDWKIGRDLLQAVFYTAIILSYLLLFVGNVKIFPVGYWSFFSMLFFVISALIELKASIKDEDKWASFAWILNFILFVVLTHAVWTF